uniref:Adrenomedullin 2 n=1 Tax=Oryctolagus cuniculus TaxID=9986 RepID=A0A5F9DM23_RABIT
MPVGGSSGLSSPKGREGLRGHHPQSWALVPQGALCPGGGAVDGTRDLGHKMTMCSEGAMGLSCQVHVLRCLCREPPARTPSGSLQPRHPAPWAVVWKPRQVPQPYRRASQAPTMGQRLRDSGQRHPGPRRTQAQLLRVGCVLGTCQVQNLSHRLWQLVRPAGRQDSAPIDPSSPHSYG